MKVEIRNDSVHISGYVNAVERNSKKLRENLGGKMTEFYERIQRGAFANAIKRNADIKVLLNHDDERELATTLNGSAELREDNIGLHAEVDINDAEVVAAARENRLVGWSFGFYANAYDMGEFDGEAVRTVTDLDLIEVSILDSSKTPAYDGTLIEARAERTLCLRDTDTEEEGEPEAEAEAEPETEAPEEERAIDIESELKALKEMIDELLDKISKEEDTEAAPEETEDEPEEAPEEDEERAEAETEQSGEAEPPSSNSEMQARATEPVRFDYTSYEERIANLKKGWS